MGAGPGLGTCAALPRTLYPSQRGSHAK